MSGKILAFGEIMLRLSARNDTTISQSTVFDACYGGTEANVLACLAAFGHKTEYLTALPETELGSAVLNHLHCHNVGTSHIISRGDVLGMYFVENGSGSRGSNVIYFRKYSEVAKLDEDAFDFDKIFDGVELFHISGISFALSESCRRLSFALVRQAKARRIPVSFDFNYRSKLWTIDEAKSYFSQVIDCVDIVLASDRDLTTFLDTDEQGYFAKYNNKLVVLRNRDIVSATRHAVSVTVFRNDGSLQRFQTGRIEFDVKEKIGGGDAFDGAFLHAWLTFGDDLKQITEFAVSAFIMKHTISGDTFSQSAAEVLNFKNKLN